MRPILGRSDCAVTAKYAGRIGKVQGDKKLKIPAMNASSVRVTIPESGRLGFGWNGLLGADLTVGSENDEESEGVEAVESESLRAFKKDELAFFKAVGCVALAHRNPTSGAGSSALEYCR